MRLLASLATALVLDRALFWLPLYAELKVAASVWLWHPATDGAGVVFDQYVVPLLDDHGPAIEGAASAAWATAAAAAGRRAGGLLAAARGGVEGGVAALRGVQKTAGAARARR